VLFAITRSTIYRGVAQLLSKITDIAGPHALTCRTPKNDEQQALSRKQVQITYATELASSDVSVYTLMKLLGHESMTTSQRYVSAPGAETRSAAARNPIYAMITTDG
jgi:site-specific recombinase XerD